MSINSSIYEKAKLLMPGGGSIGGRKHRIYGEPIYMDHADGSRLYSVDGKEFIDYHCCAGAALFGHNHPRIRAGIERAMEKGFFMNFDSQYTLEYAELFTSIVPSVEQIRFVGSGTEATQAAIRLARGYNGKELILKMDGHFHGMHEMVWFNHSNFPEIDKYGEVTKTIPDSAGFPEIASEFVKVIQFNNIDAVEHAIKKYKGRISALILEPISYNCGCLEAKKEYLKQVREICTREEIVLIFDEVISGLRMRPGSAQMYYGVTPDLSTFGKAVGGGLPIALVCGKKEVMETFNPTGPVICSGTNSSHQIAIHGGIECLKMIVEPDFYANMEKIGQQLYDGVNDIIKKNGIKGHVRGLGAQYGIYFGYEDPEGDFDLRYTVANYDIEIGKKFIKGCLENGIYFHFYGDAPYPHHCGFTSAHTSDDINITLDKMDHILSKLKSQ